MEKVTFKNRKTGVNPEDVRCNDCKNPHKKTDHFVKQKVSKYHLTTEGCEDFYWRCIHCGDKYILCDKCNREKDGDDWDDPNYHDCELKEKEFEGGFMLSESSGRCKTKK